MKVVILGAGVVGVTSAWYLREEGHEVTVIDRQPGPALETSFANGGQISVSHAEPWANPRAPRQILKWLGREDAPLLFRPRADLYQWLWGARFMIECLPHRACANARNILNLALFSADALKALRSDTGIAYSGLSKGILSFYTDQREFAQAAAHAELLSSWGCRAEAKSPEQCTAIEPAFASFEPRLAGGIFTPGDESGDAHMFSQRLAEMCVERGVTFEFSHVVRRLLVEGGRIASVEMAGRDDEVRKLNADAYVVAFGSYSAPLLPGIGISIPVYPVKGYSVTLPVGPEHHAPVTSITDDARKLVFSRLGSRLRVAGTAELAGYDTEIDSHRCEAIVQRTFELFPDAGSRDQSEFWAGLRPATPGNVPIIGRSRFPNLFVNTGHGTLGWTLACGSGKVLAEIVSGRKPEIDFPFS